MILMRKTKGLTLENGILEIHECIQQILSKILIVDIYILIYFQNLFER